MYKVLTLNNISVDGLAKLPRERYQVGADVEDPDVILLRSFKMHDQPIPPSLKAVARAGAGVNNVPVNVLTEMGIPVFNAPGANANAVKELVLAGMLLACRNICQAWDFVRHLEGDDASLMKQAEAGKKQFVGFELPGRTLGVIGLGAIGVMVANAARALGMDVIGYDPKITVQSAWRLSADVRQAVSVADLLAQSDFVTFHVPLIESTKHLINRESIRGMRDGAVILNFSRDGIVDREAVAEALNVGKLYSYVCDFANNALKDHERVIILPHLGASTRQAEDNCAIMVAEQVRDFLENGNIHNSVNFPEAVMPMSNGMRIAIANANVPNMVGQISTAMAAADLNIIDLLNKSRDQIAYTLVDVDKVVPTDVVDKLRAIDGVLNVRLIP